MPMDIADARTIYSAYVDFAKNQVETVAQGDLKKADAVAKAVTVEGEGGVRTFSAVQASADDKIGKIRGNELKQANRLTHKMFEESICSLFGKETVNELPDSVKAALGERPSDSTKPLSARRIMLIAQDVGRELRKQMNAGERLAATVSDARKDIASAMGRSVLANPPEGFGPGENGLVTAVKTSLGTVLAGFKPLMSDIRTADSDALLAEVETMVGSATDFKTLLTDLQDQAAALDVTLNAAVENGTLTVGTPDCAAKFTVLQLTRTLVRALKDVAYLQDVPTVRANAAALKEKFADGPLKAAATEFADRILASCSDERIAAGELDWTEVDKLLFVSSKEYFEAVHLQIQDHVTAVVRQQQEDLAAANLKKKGPDREASLVDATATVEAETARLEAEALSRQGQDGLSMKLGDLGKTRAAYSAAQEKHVADVKASVRLQVETSIRGEIARVDAKVPDGKLKTAALSAEERETFVKDMCDTYEGIAWRQVKNGQPLELPTEPIEDAYAKLVNAANVRQVEEALEQIEIKAGLGRKMVDCATILSENVPVMERNIDRLQKSIPNLEAEKRRLYAEMEAKTKALVRLAHGTKDLGSQEIKAAQTAQKDAQLKYASVDTALKQADAQLTALCQKLPVAMEIKENLPALLKAEQDRLNALKQTIRDSLSVDGKVIDLASANQVLAKYEAEVFATLVHVADLANGLDKQRTDEPSPAAFIVHERFGLDDPAAFVARMSRGAKNLLTSLVASVPAGKIPDDQRALLKAGLETALDPKGTLPEHLMTLGLVQCEGKTNEAIARFAVRKQLTVYVKCVVAAIEEDPHLLRPGQGLPTLAGTFETLAKKVTVNVRGTGNEVSAFGNEVRMNDVIGVLKSFQNATCTKLADDFTKLKQLFGAPDAAGEYDSPDFDTAYLKVFGDRLNAPADDKETVRDHLETMLEVILDARDTNDPDNLTRVQATARNFTETALGLAAEVEKDAYARTFAALPETDRALVGFDGTRSLNAAKHRAAFTKQAFLSENEFAALDADRIRFMIPFVKDVQALGPAKAVCFESYLRGFAEDAFPRTLVNKAPQTKEILFDLVKMKQAKDAATLDGVDPNQVLFYNGYGTFDAKEILCQLSSDGLLALPYRPLGAADGHPATAELLSFLWTLNGRSGEGLPQLCETVFGKDLAAVTRDEFKAAVDKVAANLSAKTDDEAAAMPALAGVGPFEKLTPEQVRRLQDDQAAAARLLSSGIEHLLTEKKIKTVGEISAAIRQLQDLARTRQPTELALGGVRVRVSLTEAGSMVATLPDNPRLVKWIPLTPSALAANMTESLMLHCKDKNVKGSAAEILAHLPAATDPSARDLAVLVLRNIANVDAIRLAHVPTALLVELAKEHVTKTLSEKDLDKRLAHLTDPTTNSQSILDLVVRLDRAEKAPEMKVDDLVSLGGVFDTPRGTQAKGAAMRDFAAELFASRETWTADLSGTDRLKTALKGQVRYLTELLQKPDGERTAEVQALGEAKELQDLVAGLLATLQAKVGPTVSSESVARAVDGLDTKVLAPKLAAVVNARMAALQQDFSLFFVDRLLTTGLKPADLQSLKELAGTDSIDLDHGYGAFLKKMFDSYFTGMPDFDKAGFLAAVLRDTPTGASASVRIAALVKNAGPVFIKMMQGVPAGAVPDDLKGLMSEIKDSLPSIPARIVKAQLYDMVVRSHGKIKGIEVVSSLGAASVGQALLCRIRTEANPDGEECVVKLLRPNVQNLARREAAFINERIDVNAKGKPTGLFKGRLETIRRELDLTIEAGNVDLSRHYNDITRPGTEAGNMTRVKTMELHSVIRPSVMSLVARKAPGETCEKFFASVRTRIDAILAPIRRVDSVSKDREIYRNGKDGTVVTYRTGSLVEYVTVKDKLFKLYHETKVRQNDLLNLTYKWIACAACTPNGSFIHGDLHAGNIMTGENGMTFIDFGNATRFSEPDRKGILRCLVQCGLGGAKGAAEFLNGIMALRKSYAIKSSVPSSVEKRLLAELTTAFEKGTANDTGLRFAAAVSLLQKYEVELPSSLSGLAQSLVRLQNAVESANQSLRHIENMIASLEVDADLSSHNSRTNPFDHEFYSAAAMAPNPTLEELQNAVALLRQILSIDSKDHFEAGCVTDGQFDPEKARREMLPFYERMKGVYAVAENSARLPRAEEMEGMRLYRRVAEFCETPYDLRDPKASPGRLEFDRDLAEIVKGTFHLFDTVSANLTALDETMTKKLKATKLVSFTESVGSCVDNNAIQCKEAMMSGGLIQKAKTTIKAVAGSLMDDIEKSSEKGQAEANRLNQIGMVNQWFLNKHRSFPREIVGRITEFTRTEFVYEDAAFDLSAKYDEQKAQRAMTIVTRNVMALRDMLVQGGFDVNSDAKLAGLRSAVELAAQQFAAQFGLDSAFKSLTSEQHKELKQMALAAIPGLNGGSTSRTVANLVNHALNEIFTFVRNQNAK